MNSELFDLLLNAARKWPNGIAIIDATNSSTFQELAEVVTNRARHIRKSEDSQQQIVALEGTASIDYIISLLAIIQAGHIAAPLNMRYPKETRVALSEELRNLPANVLAPNLHPHPSMVIHTSGSSRAPKAALLSYENLVSSATGVNERLSYVHGDFWLCPLPLWHVGGLGILFRTLLAGGTMILADSANIDDMILAHGPTHLSLVDTQLSRLLAIPEIVSKLRATTRAILLGGSAISTARVHAAVSAGLPIHVSYGLTEMSSTVTMRHVTGIIKTGETASSGIGLSGSEFRISEDGVIEVNGKSRFLGYLKARTVFQPFDRDGWFTTGDRGLINTSGELQVLGRADNMFISGGENIQPEEVEAILRSDARIDELAVVPVPDNTFGNRPVAVIKLHSQLSIEKIKSELESLLRSHLPGYMVPAAWFIWPADEGTAESMKIDRAQLMRYAKDEFSGRQEST